MTATVFAIAALALPAHAEDLLVTEYLAAREAPAIKQWISAAGEAIYTMNYRLEKLGQRQLFCPPERMRLMTENYLSIVRLEVVRRSKESGFDVASIADVLMDGLVRAFPCKK